MATVVIRYANELVIVTVMKIWLAVAVRHLLSVMCRIAFEMDIQA